MHWRAKSLLQSAVSLLPPTASYATYYWIQRHFGELRHFNPASRLSYGIDTWKRIIEQGNNPLGKVFFEIGTGRVPLVPLSYWLMGAKSVITIDLNPYLKRELIFESLQYISENMEEIQNLFGSLLDNTRFADLIAFSKDSSFSINHFLDLCHIEYIAPGDASSTDLPSQSIDYYTSCTVLEHIPPEVLVRILDEGNRIISNEGLFIHIIDYSDHFSHSDKNISAINFLQYSDDEWKRYAGNRYMYMNRLRHDDYLCLFESVGHRVLSVKTGIDKRSQALLMNGAIKLNSRFIAKPTDIISTTTSMIVSRKGD